MAPGPSDERWRVWIEHPDRSRDEVLREDDTIAATLVTVGTQWWGWDGATDSGLTNDGRTNSMAINSHCGVLFSPRSLMGEMIVGRATRSARCGRDTVTVTAHAVPGRQIRFGPTADRWRMWLDAEFSVFLRIEALLGDQLVETCEFTEVTFNEPIEPDRFDVDDRARAFRAAPDRIARADDPAVPTAGDQGE
jgi:hypothetical protein